MPILAPEERPLDGCAGEAVEDGEEEVWMAVLVAGAVEELDVDVLDEDEDVVTASLKMNPLMCAPQTMNPPAPIVVLFGVHVLDERP